MATSFRCLLSLVLLLGIAAPALADPPLEPAACKIAGAEHVVVGRFAITASELNGFKQTHRFPERPPGAKINARTAYRRATLAEVVAAIGTTPVSSTQRVRQPDVVKFDPPWCGIVDNWHYVAAAAHQQCNSPGMGNGNAYFKADSHYSEFNDPQNHHALYKAKPKSKLNPVILEGNCYVCRSSRSAGTATAIPSDRIETRVPAKGD